MKLVSATKANLLKSKRELDLTREGFQLLDEKRRILVGELVSLVHIVERAEEELDREIRKGYELMDKAVINMGRVKIEELALGVDINYNIYFSTRRIMGVNIFSINLDIKENAPSYSPLGVSFYVDEAKEKFKDIVNLIVQLAEKRIALLRISRELRKTIRKVNALEKIHIPFYERTVKYISERLDEETRESFSMLKLIRERLGKI
ncbi:MAG: V-type ATP synthase subunit D [Candidatus Omnitrophica bacterium]|nr:V-type ATP synthase subunit D [Candidatus Omnitrophota bacterium]MCM8823403.1 V-type ATP synthase subunit D [Candidatus Omnitrophota bacterium]MCM8826362.1 V-type ATP synthase subunit D [Candidatus Omnitrophota bacterium]